MTILIEGENSFIISAQAHLIDDERETASAWASKHIVPNPAIKWIVGNYVESNRANYNKQFWTYDDLMIAQPSVAHAPLNILHRPHHIVGAFTNTEMMYPTGETADDEVAHPYIEALSAFWKAFFPDELAAIEMAHNQGALFYSMECVAKSITCAGETGCTQEYAFRGPRHESYCDHLNKSSSIKQLNKPWFLAGALIVPPAAPGWGGANITEMSSLFTKYEEQLPDIYKAIKAEADHLNENEIEETMVEHLAVVEASDEPNLDWKKKKKKSPKAIGEERAERFLSRISK